MHLVMLYTPHLNLYLGGRLDAVLGGWDAVLSVDRLLSVEE